MSERSPGVVVAELRKSLRLGPAKLAETLGFSTVLISKIEGGVRAPSEAFIQALRSHLPENAEAIQEVVGSDAQADKPGGGSLKIVDAMKLAKKNGDRANRLKARAEHTEREADDVAQVLDEAVREFDSQVLDSFPDWWHALQNSQKT